VQTYLLGLVDFGSCLALQQRLACEVGLRDDGQIVLLLCEHPPLVTVGRGGSPVQVRLETDLIRSGRLQTQWVNRGGGCMVHLPGQLAVYPIVPLRWHGLTVGEYLDHLQTGLRRALEELGCAVQTRPDQYGIWGRTGQLVAVGVSVRNWVTYHGAFVNVGPPLGLTRLVDSDPWHGTRMSNLVAERGRAATMPAVRAAVVRHLTETLGCDGYHLYTGHPLLKRMRNDE